MGKDELFVNVDWDNFEPSDEKQATKEAKEPPTDNLDSDHQTKEKAVKKRTISKTKNEKEADTNNPPESRNIERISVNYIPTDNKSVVEITYSGQLRLFDKLVNFAEKLE